MPWLIGLLGVAGMLGLAALVVSVGPFRTRTAAALTWAGFGLLAASLVAVMLGVVVQSAWSDAAEQAQEPVVDPVPPPPIVEPGTGYPARSRAMRHRRRTSRRGACSSLRSPSRPWRPRPGAIWRDEPGAVVREVDCGDGRTMLRIDAEFAMGLVTDTTTDEQDRAVTEANLAAADRIVLAWAEAGLGTPEVITASRSWAAPRAGPSSSRRSTSRRGRAPRIEGRCLSNG